MTKVPIIHRNVMKIADCYIILDMELRNEVSETRNIAPAVDAFKYHMISVDDNFKQSKAKNRLVVKSNKTTLKNLGTARRERAKHWTKT